MKTNTHARRRRLRPENGTTSMTAISLVMRPKYFLSGQPDVYDRYALLTDYWRDVD